MKYGPISASNCMYIVLARLILDAIRLSRSHAGQLFSSESFGTCHPLPCIGVFTPYKC